VRLKIYNCLGSEVRTLVDQHQTSGNYLVIWNGKDNHGITMPNGIYIYQLKTESEIKQGQIILIK
jgi:flagellar hook assembly protein FlgD